jgi:hypothetical protein
MFALAGTDSQEIPEFIEPAAEASSRPGVLEAAHGAKSNHSPAASPSGPI